MARASEPQPELAAAIKAFRSENGLSQEDLAHQAGITTSALARIESGRVDPAWGTVRSIASGLGVSLSALAERAERAG
jgi:transcriptional regulator with XRE-family HTH domain